MEGLHGGDGGKQCNGRPFDQLTSILPGARMMPSLGFASNRNRNLGPPPLLTCSEIPSDKLKPLCSALGAVRN